MMSHIVVLVLGDIGRSPRMQYHAISFANENKVEKVTLIGYAGEVPIQSVVDNKKIQVFNLTSYEFSKDFIFTCNCQRNCFGLVDISDTFDSIKV
jgi:hypothetical protein